MSDPEFRILRLADIVDPSLPENATEEPHLGASWISIRGDALCE